MTVNVWRLPRGGLLECWGLRRLHGVGAAPSSDDDGYTVTVTLRRVTLRRLRSDVHIVTPRPCIISSITTARYHSTGPPAQFFTHSHARAHVQNVLTHPLTQQEHGRGAILEPLGRKVCDVECAQGLLVGGRTVCQGSLGGGKGPKCRGDFSAFFFSILFYSPGTQSEDLLVLF